jgi:hypothetical protein
MSQSCFHVTQMTVSKKKLMNLRRPQSEGDSIRRSRSGNAVRHPAGNRPWTHLISDSVLCGCLATATTATATEFPPFLPPPFPALGPSAPSAPLPPPTLTTIPPRHRSLLARPPSSLPATVLSPRTNLLGERGKQGGREGEEGGGGVIIR